MNLCFRIPGEQQFDAFGFGGDGCQRSRLGKQAAFHLEACLFMNVTRQLVGELLPGKRVARPVCQCRQGAGSPFRHQHLQAVCTQRIDQDGGCFRRVGLAERNG